jgi:hypothetical protein
LLAEPRAFDLPRDASRLHFRKQYHWTRPVRSHERARRKPASQRLARFHNIVDQDRQRASFAAKAADFLAPRGAFLGIAAVNPPVAVPWLTAAFAFLQGIAGFRHSNLKIREGGTPSSLILCNRPAEDARPQNAGDPNCEGQCFCSTAAPRMKPACEEKSLQVSCPLNSHPILNLSSPASGRANARPRG